MGTISHRCRRNNRRLRVESRGSLKNGVLLTSGNAASCWANDFCIGSGARLGGTSETRGRSLCRGSGDGMYTRKAHATWGDADAPGRQQRRHEALVVDEAQHAAFENKTEHEPENKVTVAQLLNAAEAVDHFGEPSGDWNNFGNNFVWRVPSLVARWRPNANSAPVGLSPTATIAIDDRRH